MRLLPGLAPSFASDRSWTFDVPAEQLWTRLTATGEYEDWWPWLVRFDPAGGFRCGSSWACTVVPPLPYQVRFALHLDEVEVFRLVRARVSGDIRGDALLTIDERDGGCTARLRSRLSPANPLLRGVGIAARPLVAWGHDWVLDSGERQFVERALPTGPG